MGTRKVTRETLKARELRRTQTPEERLLWQAIRNNALGVKFRRQRPSAGYIVDFVCFEAKLIVELDGSQHAEEDAKAYDAVRTKTFEAGSFKVIRFWNNEIRANLDGVLQRIQENLS